MKRPRLDKDVIPLSRFRATVAACVRDAHERQRPFVITQHGKAVAVMLGAAEYEEMRERIELTEDVQRAEAQIDAGRGVPHAKAKARVLKGIA